MILTDDEVSARLDSPENLLNKVRIERAVPKKHEGDTSVPPMVRGLIAKLSIEGTETDKEIGSVFGVSQPTVSNAARGLVGDRLDTDLSNIVNGAKTTIKEKTEDAHEAALDALLSSLNAVGPKIIADTGATVKELTNNAKNLSFVIVNLKKMQEDNPVNNNTVVILHPPEKRKEANYDIIDV